MSEVKSYSREARVTARGRVDLQTCDTIRKETRVGSRAGGQHILGLRRERRKGQERAGS